MVADYERYSELRDKKGVTDYKVATAAGIPKSTFSDWKSGRSKPKADKLFKIAQVLEVPMETLMKEPAAVEG